MSKKRVFITGATSKIGKYLVDRLDFSKYDIYALCRDKDHKLAPPVKIIPGDLSDPGSYSPVFENNIDIVIHLGAVTHTNDIDRYYKINAEATLQLVRSCEANNVKRFIFVSTRAISENGGDYSKSKAIAETYVRESRLDWVIMRLAEVYGISDNEGVDLVLNNIKKMLMVPIIGDGEYSIAPVHVSDVVSAIIAVIEKDEVKGKLYNIAGPENFTYNKFIERILELYGVKKIKIHVPVVFASVLLRVYAAVYKNNPSLVIDQLPRLLSDKSYDISEAVRELGFAPLNLESFIGKNGRV